MLEDNVLSLPGKLGRVTFLLRPHSIISEFTLLLLTFVIEKSRRCCVFLTPLKEWIAYRLSFHISSDNSGIPSTFFVVTLFVRPIVRKHTFIESHFFIYFFTDIVSYPIRIGHVSHIFCSLIWHACTVPTDLLSQMSSLTFPKHFFPASSILHVTYSVLSTLCLLVSTSQ